MPREQLFIHARLVVKAFQVGFGGQLDEVAVAGLVLCQQDEVVILLIGGGFAGAAIGSDVYLAADDGLDARLGRFLVKLDGAVHHAVVGNCQGIHAQFLRPRYQLGDAAHAIEQAEFSVDMEVSEHSAFLTGDCLIIAQGEGVLAVFCWMKGIRFLKKGANINQKKQ